MSNFSLSIGLGLYRILNAHFPQTPRNGRSSSARYSGRLPLRWRRHQFILGSHLPIAAHHPTRTSPESTFRAECDGGIAVDIRGPRQPSCGIVNVHVPNDFVQLTQRVQTCSRHKRIEVRIFSTGPLRKSNINTGFRQAEVAVFAASWVCLLSLRDKGYRLEKFTARMLQLLDA